MSGSPVILTVSGLGEIPSFKNRKMPANRRIITRPETQQWMERCVRSFASQLSSAMQTCAGGTATDNLRQSWIASSVPADDCWTEVEYGSVTATLDPGNVGATIVIERLA